MHIFWMTEIARSLRGDLPPGYRAVIGSSPLYRVGAAGGRMLAVWQYHLAIGEPLPSVPLPLTLDASVQIDLEATYGRAAADSYVV
jgi:hypothetical protein